MQWLRAKLVGELFLDAPRERWKLSAWEGALLVTALLVLAIVLQLARIGWSSSLNVLWAEDGRVFMQEALTHSMLNAVTTTYATYLVVAPRLIAEVASLAPLRDLPAAISILSAATVALSGFIVWLASAAHIRNPYLRGTLAVLTVLTPVAGVESVDSAAYVLWYMLFASFWILLWRPASWRGTFLASAFILITGLSTPGLWFFAPVAVLRMIAVRDRRDLLILFSYATGAVVQIPIVILSKDLVATPVWSHDIWTATLQRLIAETPLGLHLAGNAWNHLGWPLLTVLVVACITGLLAGWKRSSTGARWIAGLAIPISLVMFVASLYQRAVAEQMVWTAGTYNYLGSRYVIVPSLLLISAAIVLIDGWARRSPASKPVTRARFAIIAVLAIALVTSFWLRDLVLRGTPWKATVEAAAQQCEATGSGEAVIATSPPGWSMQLPCDQIAPGPSPRA
jgi:hypothetical protein